MHIDKIADHAVDPRGGYSYSPSIARLTSGKAGLR
jgi:hypothetical protein